MSFSFLRLESTDVLSLNRLVFYGFFWRFLVMEGAFSAKEQSPSQWSGRFCIGKGCTRQISSESLDPHNSCVKCRGGVCTPDSRCDDCKEWQEDTVLTAYKYQHSLGTQWKSFTKRRSSSLHLFAVPPGKQVISSFVQDEECRDCSVLSPHSSMDPGPSASQVVAPPRPAGVQEQLTSVLSIMSQFASFLGLSGTTQPTCLKEVVEETVVRELPNFVSVSVPLLSTAVTSSAPPSPDAPPLIDMSQVGVAGCSHGPCYQFSSPLPRSPQRIPSSARYHAASEAWQVAQHGSVTSYDEPRPLDSHESWLGDEVSSPQPLCNAWQGSDGRSQVSSAGKDEQQTERNS
ncbi:hypothetical protein E2C01_061815 [Portunus trituberculatus]|uniref:Uncharacterized protein n=1 Tax=Portunus trituberculatus TaxID=210409 RepID=A0A5B7HFG4_PORTR|nr:hypothetical protein [Portunus trituberculatus]